jgi:hypothetical protein
MGTIGIALPDLLGLNLHRLGTFDKTSQPSKLIFSGTIDGPT